MITTHDKFNDLPFVYNGRVKIGSWKEKNNRKIYFEYLGEKLGYDTPEKWYKLTTNILSINHGGSILNFYKGSHIKFVIDMLPEYEWFEFLFNSSPKHLWDFQENHERYGIWLGRIKQYNTLEDWYNCSLNVFSENRGRGLISSKYDDSPYLFILTVISKFYPGQKLLPWKLDKCPQHFWDNFENQKEYILWLGNELGYTKMEDWYNLNSVIINENYGNALLHKYNGSPSLIVKTIFHNDEWFEWLFKMSPLNIFDSYENRKKYFIWLGKKLGYYKPEHWYNLTTKILNKNDGRTIGSVKKFLSEMFPEYEWLEWKFIIVSTYYWDDLDNVKKYILWLGNELGYTKMEDWYDINVSKIYEKYGGGLLASRYNCSPSLLVSSILTNYPWILSKFKKNYSRGQIEWLEYICIKTPDVIHILNNTNGEFYIPETKYHADGYSKNKNIIYEYHGDFWHGNPDIYNEYDINKVAKKTFGELYKKTLKKQTICQELGYKYITIWESEWVRGKIAIIHIQRIFRKYKNLINLE